MELDLAADGCPVEGLGFNTGPGVARDGEVDVSIGGVRFAVRQARGASAEDGFSLDMDKVLWEAGAVLAQFLERQCLQPQDAAVPTNLPVLARAAAERRAGRPTSLRAIELGAGCAALPGLALAALACDEVTLTDISDALPLLRENVRRFSDAFPPGVGARVTVAPLDWASPADLAHAAAGEGYDVVVAADVAFAEGMVESFVQAAMACLKPTGVLVLQEGTRSQRLHYKVRSSLGAAQRFATVVAPSARGAHARPLDDDTCTLVSRWQCASDARDARRRLAAAAPP